jgi:hypothetical protein
MATERQLKANRANARRSTGPRSAVGKAICRFNARRHGLEMAIENEPGAGEELEELARAIAGSTTNADLLAAARAIAKAEIMVRRVFRARAMRRFTHDGAEEKNTFDVEGAFERAERRAVSRRKSAIRFFDLLKSEYVITAGRGRKIR